MRSAFIILLLLAGYAFIQILYYIKNGHKKQIIIFIVLFAISAVYIYDYLYNVSLKNPFELITALYKPISVLLFNCIIE